MTHPYRENARPVARWGATWWPRFVVRARRWLRLRSRIRERLEAYTARHRTELDRLHAQRITDTERFLADVDDLQRQAGISIHMLESQGGQLRGFLDGDARRPIVIHPPPPTDIDE